MLKQTKEYLPIGTVVRLIGGQKRIMIFGIIQVMEEDPMPEKNGEYDYIGVPYPEGNMGQNFQYLFNHKDIEQVYFRGYEDFERENFMIQLEEYIKQQENL